MQSVKSGETDSVIIGDGEMAQRIRAFSWAATSLGPLSKWPTSLATMVNFMLQSPVPLVMLWDKDGVMLYNDAYSVFAGGRHPQLLGSKVVEGWPEVADFNRNVMKHGLAGKTLEYKDQRLTLYRNNVAEEVWMDLTYSPVIDESGKPAGVMAIVMETTERIHAEQRQVQAEAAAVYERERLRSLFMQAPAMVAVLRGPEHVFELTNPPYLRLVGKKRIVGKTVRQALPEIEGQGFFELLDEVYRTGKPFVGKEVPIELDREGDGNTQTAYLNFVYQPSFDEHKAVDGILVHVVDVTDLVLARKQVEEIANLNKTLTDNATTALLVMDTRRYVTFMNPAAEHITGYTFKQVLEFNKPLHDIIHHTKPDGSPFPMSECPIDSALPTKDRAAGEGTFVRPDGSFYPVRFMASPVRRDGETIGIVIEARDVTKEKAVEEEIMQLTRDLERRVEERTRELTAANKELERSNEELQDFAYVASHDLQEPLRKIIAFSGVLASDYKDELPEDAHLYLDGLQRSSQRMRTLISDLLTYSRVTTKARPFEMVDLKAAVTESLEDLQSRINETGAKVTVGRLGAVEGDPLQIRLLLQNLISNAIKYARDGVAPEISVKSVTKGGICRISVTDNGIGFDEQYLPKIFTIFQRLHGKGEYEGTGIGLAISKKIAERHCGTITATSKVGAGSTFVVELPVKQ